MAKTDDTFILQSMLPIDLGHHKIAEETRVGLIIVDEVNGFCTVGWGPLAPKTQNPQVTRMVAETAKLARYFDAKGWPIAAFLDTHEPGKPEHPYPPHCEAGTGQEELVDELKWLEDTTNALLIRKDCINGLIGSVDGETGKNRIIDWIVRNRLQSVIVVGICTDICVLQFVQSLLSARNHGMTGELVDIVVYEPGCATYDLPVDVACSLGLPKTAAHPQAAAHHMGLYLMASSGAIVVDRLDF
jgi:nicotinamidase-related amidase